MMTFGLNLQLCSVGPTEVGGFYLELCLPLPSFKCACATLRDVKFVSLRFVFVYCDHGEHRLGFMMS